eukprot:TRINITY_DN7095_c0_g1_i1.p1 TRINITY_DN7095_c0_g1~~TRINITY_DN7095_c0_g1_i1.p1  ORF type:complete len:1298 (+),score=359.53 TRINITY_DN7095_c0_g1_i1:90-3896(+)
MDAATLEHRLQKCVAQRAPVSVATAKAVLSELQSVKKKHEATIDVVQNTSRVLDEFKRTSLTADQAKQAILNHRAACLEQMQDMRRALEQAKDELKIVAEQQSLVALVEQYRIASGDVNIPSLIEEYDQQCLLYEQQIKKLQQQILAIEHRFTLEPKHSNHISQENIDNLYAVLDGSIHKGVGPKVVDDSFAIALLATVTLDQNRIKRLATNVSALKAALLIKHTNNNVHLPEAAETEVSGSSEALKKELTQEREHRTALEADVTQLRTTLEEVRTEGYLLATENERLVKLTEANEEKMTSLVEALEDQMKIRDDRLVSLMDTCESLRKVQSMDESELKNSVLRLTEELNTTQAALDRARASVESARRSELEDLQEEMQRVLQERDAAIKEVDELDQKVTTETEANIVLRATLSQVTSLRLQEDDIRSRIDSSASSEHPSDVPGEGGNDADAPDLSQELDHMLLNKREAQKQLAKLQNEVIQERKERIEAQARLQSISDQYRSLLKVFGDEEKHKKMLQERATEEDQEAAEGATEQATEEAIDLESGSDSEENGQISPLADLENLNDEIARLQAELDIVQTSLSQANEVIAAQRPQLEHLEHVSDERAQRIMELSEQLEEAAEANRSLHVQLDATKTKMETSTAELARRTRRESVALTSTSQSEQFETSSDTAQRFQSLDKDLLEERRRVTELQALLLEKSAELEIAQKTTAEQTDKITQLTMAADDATAQAKEAWSNAHTFAKELDAERTNVESVLRQLEEQAMQSKQVIIVREEEIEALQTRLSAAEAALEQQQEEQDTMHQRKHEAEDQVAALKQERDSALADVQTAQDALENLRTLANRMEQDFNSKLTETRQRYEAEIERLRNQSKALKSTIADLKIAKKEAVQERDEEHEKAADQLNQAYKHHKAMQDKQTAIITHLQSQLAESRNGTPSSPERSRLHYSISSDQSTEDPSIQHLVDTLLQRLPETDTIEDVQALRDLALALKQQLPVANDPESSSTSPMSKQTFQKLSRAVDDLWKRFDSSPFVRLGYKMPRLNVVHVPSIHAGGQAAVTTKYDNNDKNYWMTKVTELTGQMQQSSEFWLKKVKAANDAMAEHQQSCQEVFTESHDKTRLVTRLLFDLVKALLNLLTCTAALTDGIEPDFKTNNQLALAVQRAASSISALRDTLFELPPSPQRSNVSSPSRMSSPSRASTPLRTAVSDKDLPAATTPNRMVPPSPVRLISSPVYRTSPAHRMADGPQATSPITLRSRLSNTATPLKLDLDQ